MKGISLYFILLLALSLFSCKQEDKQPNIIFLFADDQSFNTINALGNSEVITPNLDKMAASGVTFTNAYNMGSWTGAVCVASRTMMNTGHTVWRANQNLHNMKQKTADGQIWGQLMQQAGYDTYMTGKWHVSAPVEEVFNHSVHVRAGMPKDGWNHAQMVQNFKDLEAGTKWNSYTDFMPNGYNRPLSKDDNSWSPYDKSKGGFWEGGTHWSEVLASDAVGFIDQAKGGEKPFFMYLAFNATHDPRQAPKEFIDMYPKEEIAVPESFQPLYPYKDSIGCGPKLRDAALAPFPRTEYAVQTHRQEYYALISHMDTQIGLILEALEASGELDNTYIFYTADHGLAVGEHGLLGKQNMYDHSVRTPFMVIGPDVPHDKKLKTDVYLQDVMASVLDLAGVEKPVYVEFNSVMPIIRGAQKESSYPAIYGCYMQDKQRMVRADGYKLILYPHGKTQLLFDLTKDPLEMNNLADDVAYNAIKSKLFKQLLDLQKQYDDPLDLTQYFDL